MQIIEKLQHIRVFCFKTILGVYQNDTWFCPKSTSLVNVIEWAKLHSFSTLHRIRLSIYLEHQKNCLPSSFHWCSDGYIAFAKSLHFCEQSWQNWHLTATQPENLARSLCTKHNSSTFLRKLFWSRESPRGFNSSKWKLCVDFTTITHSEFQLNRLNNLIIILMGPSTRAYPVESGVQQRQYRNVIFFESTANRMSHYFSGLGIANAEGVYWQHTFSSRELRRRCGGCLSCFWWTCNKSRSTWENSTKHFPVKYPKFNVAVKCLISNFENQSQQQQDRCVAIQLHHLQSILILY